MDKNDTSEHAKCTRVERNLFYPSRKSQLSAFSDKKKTNHCLLIFVVDKFSCRAAVFFGVDFDWMNILQRTRLSKRWWEHCLCSCLTHEAIVSGIKLGNIIICAEVIKQTFITWRSLLDLLVRELQLLSFAIPRQHHEWIGTATTRARTRKNIVCRGGSRIIHSIFIANSSEMYLRQSITGSSNIERKICARLPNYLMYKLQ